MNKHIEPPLHATEEQIRLAGEAREEFERTGMGITFDDMRAWAEARATDPEAPCPPARRLR